MITKNGFIAGDIVVRTHPVLAHDLIVKGVRMGRSYKVERVIDILIIEIQTDNSLAFVSSERFRKISTELNKNSKTI